YKLKHNNLPSRVEKVNVNNKDKIITFIKDEIIYAFNLNPLFSFENYIISIGNTKHKNYKDYKLIFSSDDNIFGGFDRVDKSILYPVFELSENNTKNYGISIYLPARTALAFERLK
ncbi:MAG: alpha amylase C-terminal domain-containing protein, partial [Exilispira sp.]